jgi:surface antigen
VGRKKAGSLETRIQDDAASSQGAGRSLDAAAGNWQDDPDDSPATSGHRKLQPRVRTTVAEPETPNPTRRATQENTGAHPSAPGRDRRSRYSLPGQSGIMFSGAADAAPMDAAPAPSTEISGVYPAASGVRQRATGRPAPGDGGDTGIGPAIAGEGDEPRRRARRRITSARPIRPEDRAMVTATTQMLQALEVVQEDAIAAAGDLPALLGETAVAPFEEAPTSVVPVTVVPATLAPPPAWLTPPPRRRRRSLVSGVLTCAVALGLLLGVLQAVAPIGAAPAPVQSFTLLTGQLDDDANLPAPTGPWDTSVSVSGTLGLGGGAAPGTKAPGSAGLPSTGKSGNPGGTSSGPSTRIYAAPLHPWPPADQFHTYPPGYHAFGVSKPADGYYYWAFGQCTWWAQNKRRDENLRHMGNAMYWAGSAQARGYRVGRTPANNATVVFQPGVQGAGGAGHVAHVERVYPGGWFLVSEMNFYWNGGGWGRVDYRYAHSGYGVSFIY